MIKKIKNNFLFTGVEKEEYDRVLSNINRANRTMVVVFSGLATLLIAVMCLLSLVIQSTVQNRVVYSLGF